MKSVTLKNATNKLCIPLKDLSVFRFYIKRALFRTGNLNTILKEGEVVEIQCEDVTISFTWDMISAVNNITHEYVDLMTYWNVLKVFD